MIKKKSKLRPLSKKRALRKKDYTEAYKEQDRLALENEGIIVCSSCGRTLVGNSGQGVWPWGHSHNLSVKHFPKFESDLENFKPRCQNYEGVEGCHEKLDYPKFEDIIWFLDFQQLMDYRRTHDPYSYNKWVSCLNALGLNHSNYEYENCN